MPTSPLVHEETSFVFSNPTTAFGEHQSYDTTIPFLDENRQSSASVKSSDTPSRRARNWSRLSERRAADNQSTVTVNPFSHFPSQNISIIFSALPTQNTHQICTYYSSVIPTEFHRNKYSIKK